MEPGTQLVMEVSSPGMPPRHLEHVLVVHSEPVGEGEWLNGCSFIE
jgi:hypothetical protein